LRINAQAWAGVLSESLNPNIPEGGITMGIPSRFVRKASGFCVVVLSLLLAACGGGGGYGGGTGGAGSYTIGGTVSGLTLAGESVSVTLVGLQTLQLMNASYSFSSYPLATGAMYQVTATSSTGGKNCMVANGTSTVGTTNVTNVDITCA
jgi:hypothetical protein